MKNFGILGAAGFVAPRHLRAISETNGNLLAAMDPFDSVGILDGFFPAARFFKTEKGFSDYLRKIESAGEVTIDYISICSPNYLHPQHCQLGLQTGADAICEKPLALDPKDLDQLELASKSSGKNIWNILQSRLHPDLIALREKILKGESDKVYDIDLTYLTSRGDWYHTSWKGSEKKSGGIATNIGVHFFDMLSWIFGPPKSSRVHLYQKDAAAGYLELQQARVRWFLSLNATYLPESAITRGINFYRSLTIDGAEIEFSEGFKDLHTRAYEEILKGNGTGIDAVRPAIEIVHDIRTQTPVGMKGDYHPLLKEFQASFA